MISIDINQKTRGRRPYRYGNDPAKQKTMPQPSGPLIAGGADVLSAGINAVLTSEQNRKNREFAKQQTFQARRWAMDDWAMQNQYNSPAEQMKRLREAGLNPNLVYGNGAVQQGANIANTQQARYEGKAPQIDLGGAVGSYLNAKQQQLQNDNLTAQNKVLIEQQKNIAADTMNKLFGADIKEFDFNLKTQLRNNSLAKAWEITKNLNLSGNLTQEQIASTRERTATEVATRQPRVAQIMQGISESTQRILNMRLQAAKTSAETSYVLTQIENAVKDGTIKQLEINLKKLGLSWSDPAWQRKVAQALSSIGL